MNIAPNLQAQHNIVRAFLDDLESVNGSGVDRDLEGMLERLNGGYNAFADVEGYKLPHIQRFKDRDHAKHALECLRDRIEAEMDEIGETVILPASETRLALWRDKSGDYHLTRFVWGHEDGGLHFDTRKAAYEAAEICKKLCHANVDYEAGEESDTSTYRHDLHHSMAEVAHASIGGSPWVDEVEDALGALRGAIDTAISGNAVLAEIYDRRKPKPKQAANDGTDDLPF